MGVFDRVTDASSSRESSASGPYVCLACGSGFEVQHHSCPACGGFDVRRSKWLSE